MIVEIEIEGMLFRLEGLESITSFKGFKRLSEDTKLKEPEKAWRLIVKAKDKNKKSKKD
jgi:hypothetical protein